MEPVVVAKGLNVNPNVVKILFLAANPVDMDQRRLDQEVRAIDRALRLAEFRDCFQLEPHWAVRVTEIEGLLLQHRPHIVHFTGYASDKQELVFLDDEGKPHPVTSQALSQVFRVLRDNIRCVVLNACYSVAQAQGIAEHIDAVVGLARNIPDSASSQFSSAFYQGLAYGRSVRSAFELGKAQIDLVTPGHEDAPQLISPRMDPSQIVFVRQDRTARLAVMDPKIVQLRADLLDSVHDRIGDLLQASLYRENLLNLGIKVRPDAVFPTLWDMVVRRPHGAERVFSPDVRSSTIFEELRRSLLILGEPGAGKTTMLVDLAQVAIRNARGDLADPIPVVFNLASWAERRLPIAEWLVNELRFVYDCHKKVAQQWVENDDFMLLLDGLDQVNADARAACARAINDFLDEHLVPVAIGCRVKEYDELGIRLNVRNTIVLQPLSDQQIERFLDATGLQESALATALNTDANLRQLAQSPLMLNIMAMVSNPLFALPDGAKSSQTEDLSKRLFDLYVEKMLRWRTSAYTPAQTVESLVFLAKQLARHGRDDFLIENLQPSWLERRGDRLLFAIGIRAVTSLLFLVLCALFAVPTILLGVGPIEAVTGGIIVGLLYLAPFGFTSVVVRWMPAWSAIGFTITVITLLSTFSVGFPGNLFVGYVLGLAPAFAGVAVAQSKTVAMTDRLTWSWRRAGYGGVLGVVAAVVIGLTVALTSDIRTSIGNGIATGFLVGPAAMLITGLTPSMTERSRKIPNQGFYESLGNAIRTAAPMFVLEFVAVTLILALLTEDGPQAAVAFGLTLGAGISLAVGLVQGGAACLQQVLVRLLLHWRDCLPWSCQSFLNSAAERILLHKVGGSYVFIHPLLQSYFAHGAESLSRYHPNATHSKGGEA